MPLSAEDRQKYREKFRLTPEEVTEDVLNAIVDIGLATMSVGTDEEVMHEILLACRDLMNACKEAVGGRPED